MKLSLQIGSRELSFGFGKSLSQLAAAWMRGDDVEASGAQMSSAYEQSTWVYSCIGAIAKQLAQIPLQVSRGNRSPMKARSLKWRRRAIGEDLVESGPLIELLNRPHPQLSRFDFWYLFVAWLMLRGDFFAVPTTQTNEVVPMGDGRAGNQIKRLAILSPDQILEDIQQNELLGWRYNGSTRTPMPSLTLLPEEVIFGKLPNPYDFWRGMAPLTVARLAAQSDYASAQFEKGLMLNNADTGVIVSTDQQVDEAQREAILAALRSRKRKAGTADRPLFLWGGAKVEKPTISSADLQFLENRKFKRQEICAVFSTPQEILGFTEDANRSVSDAARLNFIENAVTPIAELAEAALEPLARTFDRNYFVWFDVDALPIMQRARQTRFATASAAMTTMGIPLNVLNPLFDLGLPDDLPHGDAVLLPFSLQEYGEESPEPAEPNEAEETDEPAEPAQELFARAKRLLAAESNGQDARATPHVCAPNPEYEASIAGSVKSKAGALRKFFFEQRARVLAALAGEVGRAALPRSQAEQQLVPTKAIDDLFKLSDENAKLFAKLKSRLIADLQFGGAQLFKEIGSGIDFNLAPKDALQFLEKRRNPIENINATTWERLRGELSEGITAGEGYNALADRVKQVYTNASQERADVIAFTETNIAVNSGRHTAMKQALVERKGWQTSHLENTRATHIANERLSKEQNGIPVDDLWPNGLLYPGDPAGEPGETINCRCFGYAILGDKKDRPLLAYDEWLASRADEPAPAAPEPLKVTVSPPAVATPPPVNVTIEMPKPKPKRITLEHDEKGRVVGATVEEAP